MTIIDHIEQGDPEWFAMRCGSIGGSSISSAVAGGQGNVRKTLMYRMAGEILSGEKYQGYQSKDMLRGTELEPKARDCYALMADADVDQVAMVKSTDHKHYSPDGLINSSGLLEIKCVIPSTHIETILSDRIPSAYRKQCQWGMHICELDWVDFASYSPSVKDRPIFIIRGGRDEKLIRDMDEGADKFISEMLELVKRVRG